MKNVYDIKFEKNLNFILPKNDILSGELIPKKILVVLHLHYPELVDRCMKYVESIPDFCDVAITSSNEEVLNLLREKKNQSRLYDVVQKDNRGRDISAFLVALREKILQYEVVCFTHDKKGKTEEKIAAASEFMYCLWENTLASRDYIFNVLLTLQRNQNLGLLLPPEVIHPDFMPFIYDIWGPNFENLEKLVRDLNLNCDITYDKRPLSVGTAFWAKTKALTPLFEKEWRYEDFPQEPMGNDGTISHAIERVFAYVAQSEGYETGIVMTDWYAGLQREQTQAIGTTVYAELKNLFAIDSYLELVKYSGLREKLREMRRT